MTITGATLKDRFIEEQEYIARYIDFIGYKTAMNEAGLVRVSRTLEDLGIAKLDFIRDAASWRKPYTREELLEAFNIIKPYIDIVGTRVAEIEQEVELYPAPPNLDRIDIRETQGELIQYMLDALENDISEENIERAKQELIEQAEELENINGYSDISLRMVDYAIRAALHLIKAKGLNELEEALATMRELEIATRMANPDAEINVLRQSFIVLMTIFDATKFDIVRIALKKNFFGLISTFGRQDRVSLESLGKFGSFENFRDNIIEEQLKAKYLKEVLYILNDLKVECTDPTKGNKFIHLIEAILRRNLHVHNRGRVDEKYLERNSKGAPIYNIYNLPLGAIAEVDQIYWERVNALCRDCVSNVAQWADSV